MKNILIFEEHPALITFDPELEMFRGEFTGLNGGADFYAYSVDELKKEGAISLKIYLDECKKDGISPYKSFSGKISARLTPERHRDLTLAAQATGHSLNELLIEGTDWVIAKYTA